MSSFNPVVPLLAHLKQGVPLTMAEAYQGVKEMREYNYTLMRIVIFLTVSAILFGLVKQISHHPFAHYALYLHMAFWFCFVIWSLASIWHASFFEDLQLITEEEAKQLKPSSLLDAINKQGRRPFRMEMHWLK